MSGVFKRITESLRSWLGGRKKRESGDKSRGCTPYALKSIIQANGDGVRISARSPGVLDNKYSLGQKWINKETEQEFILKVNARLSNALWEEVKTEKYSTKEEKNE